MENTAKRPFRRPRFYQDITDSLHCESASKRVQTGRGTGSTAIATPHSTSKHSFQECEQTAAALLEDLSLRTSTVSSGSQQEVDSASWTSITSEACNSREIEWMPTEMARDVKSLSSLSENQTGEHCSINVPPLSQFQQIVVDKYPDLRSTMLEDSHRNSLLEITHRAVHHYPPAGYVYRVRMVLFVNNGKRYCYDIQALLVSVKVGVVSTDEGFVELCNTLLHCKGFVFCPGIGYQKYHDSYYSVICFHIALVNFSNSPFQRVEAQRCLRWYKLPKNATLQEKSSDEVCVHIVNV